jgi:hypothetical protein
MSTSLPPRIEQNSSQIKLCAFWVFIYYEQMTVETVLASLQALTLAHLLNGTL